jgi:hypothetical protein
MSIYKNDIFYALDFKKNSLTVHIEAKPFTFLTIPDFSNLKELVEISKTLILFQ